MQLISESVYSSSQGLVSYRNAMLAGTDEPSGAAPDTDEHDALRARNAELEQRLAVITGSRSWRITAPLRRLAERRRSE